MRRPSITALPIAHVVLRILILLNWFVGTCILALLLFTFISEPWTIEALGVSGYPDARKVMNGMRIVAGIGIISIPLNYMILKRLLGMVETVRAGDPFVAANAFRLEAIAWLLLSLQLLSMVIAGIGEAISTPGHSVDLDAGLSVSGWLAVLLTFVLARVFAEGADMREDLKRTV